MRHLSLILLWLPLADVQALKHIDDAQLSEITGFSGITIESENLGVSASEIRYSDDGSGVLLKNFELAPVAGQESFDSKTTYDVGADGSLHMHTIAQPRDVSIGSIELDGSNKSFGSVFGRYQYENRIAFKPNVDGSFDLSGSSLSLQAERLFYRDQGLDLVIDDFEVTSRIDNGQLQFDNSRMNLLLGDINNRGMNFQFRVGAVGLDATHFSNGELGYTTALSQTFGSLDLNFDAYGSIAIEAGGATGEGLTFIPALTLINDDPNQFGFRYRDDGNLILAKSFSGTVSTVNGFTIDIENSANSDPYMAVRFSDFDFAFNLEDAVLGGTDPNSNTIGSFGGEFHFRNENGRENALYLRTGGDGDDTGITADISWNLVSDPYDVSDGYPKPGALNTFVSMIDDGNHIIFNGFNSYGSGRITMDLTSRNDSVVGNAGTKSIYASDYDGHFDGIRLGFQNVTGGYYFSGVTVGRTREEALDSALMGGTELLLSAEIFPAYDFTVNGHLTYRPGNIHSGSQGITMNSDLFITDANAALTVDENQRGIWLTDADYDIHMRDASIDITEDGLTFNKGLSWSTLNIGDIKFGGKADGASLGSFKLERLEDGSTISIASGGAGQVCIGGSGSTAAACTADGGRFEDRGEEGLSIKVKGIFVEDDGSPQYAGKGNRFSWKQTSGTTIAMENFSTNDGDGSGSNDYGLNVDLAVDVAETRVLDSSGNPITPNPLGFAVLGRVHFKQMNIDRITLAGPAGSASETPQTLINGIVIQNADIQANLTATPIR